MYKICIFVFFKIGLRKIHNYTREFEHHNHEIAGGKRQDVRL
jgi:hypothetical protein